jgi:ATP-dependent RNA helicase RhlE
LFIHLRSYCSRIRQPRFANLALRSLPGPNFIKTVEMSFASLNLIPELLRAVEDQGYTEPTPIQAQAIPAILARLDIMGCAQTGTGKTAGFTLPLLQLLAPYATTNTSPARHPVRALVLVPTRELAAQVEESVRRYGKHLPLRAAVVYGGIDIKPQIKALHAGVEILVATPGRLLDHLQQKSTSLSRVEILVLDEADRMLDMGFLPDIERILALLPPVRQNLLFSATFSKEIRRLADEFMRSPTMIEVARQSATADLVTHSVYEVAAARKHALLAHLVRSRDMQQVLIFTRMKRDADRLSRQLQRDGLAATAIHSDRSQGERTLALDEFKRGQSRILVATDVAARGLDIDQLPFVINYELPHTPDDYVHRIGRTGRAGTPGEAISLVSPEEMEFLAKIEKLLKRQIPRVMVPELDDRSRGADRDASRDRGAARARPRDRGDENSARSRSRAQREKSAPPPATAGNDPHFDFSKPYEPAVKEGATPAAEPESHKRKPGRPTGALLRSRPKAKTED